MASEPIYSYVVIQVIGLDNYGAYDKELLLKAVQIASEHNNGLLIQTIETEFTNDEQMLTEIENAKYGG